MLVAVRLHCKRTVKIEKGYNVDESRLTLLVVYAHPDDESFSMGGTLAKAAAQGRHTVLICATKGEAGEIHDPDLDPEAARQRLAEIREGELRRACAILNIAELHFLGYRDSGMVGTPENDDPRNFHNANLEEATERVVRHIRQAKPHVVVTSNERGDYGHPDHLAAHKVTLAAVAAAADPARFPNQELPAWQVQKLYYPALPRSYFVRMGEMLRAHGIEAPFANQQQMNLDDITVPDEQITTRIVIGEFLRKKREALLAHRTQVGTDSWLFKLPAEIVDDFFAMETFTRVQAHIPIPEQEDDLFAGLS
jgi:LmbE family N-acetylglucosaminyl deacetylase